MRNTYKNSIRSKRLMREAMLTLLKTKPLNEITVTDIVRVADLNRGTFYNHYNTTIDIIEEMKNELIEKLADGLKTVKKTDDIVVLIDAINEHIKINEEDYRIVVQTIPTAFFDNMKSQIFIKITEINAKAPSFGLYFIVNAIAGLYLDYFKGILPYSFDTMTNECKNIVVQLAKSADAE